MDVKYLVAGGVLAASSLYFLRKFFAGGICYSQIRLDGKTVIITGCNSGIGKETARDMSRRGAKVIMACRNFELANKAADEIRAETGGDIKLVHLDLSSLNSVRKCAKEILQEENRIDILINNAGLFTATSTKKTGDGFELHMGTNHLGHFLFTNLLLDKIKAADEPARIINVSSMGHKYAELDIEDIHMRNRACMGSLAYANSKLANVLFTKELANRLKDTKVTTYSLHPGVVKTEVFRDVERVLGPFKYLMWLFIGFFVKNSQEGAQTTIYCAVDEACAKESGLYYADCHVATPSKCADDEEMAKKLWRISEKEVNL